MIALKNITRNKRQIICEAYIEDCPEMLLLTFNEVSGDFEPYTLPNGYDWCDGHIAHAARYLETLIEKDFEPHDRMIMWY